MAVSEGMGGEVKPKKKKKRDNGHNLRDLMTAFAICNNVTPVLDDPEIDKVLEVKDPEAQKRYTEQPKFGKGGLDRSPGLDKPRKSYMGESKMK